jgi:RsiW-degrading membrane proteinase PrsW (M82 family)
LIPFTDKEGWPNSFWLEAILVSASNQRFNNVSPSSLEHFLFIHAIWNSYFNFMLILDIVDINAIAFIFLISSMNSKKHNKK